MKQLILISTVGLLMTVAGCTKFLDVLPKGLIIPEKTSDYEGILNAMEIGSINTTPHLLLSDDFFATYAVAPFNASSNTYYWRGRVDELPTDLPQSWGDQYNNIRSLNLVTSEVLHSTGGTEQQKKQLYAEAQVLKIYEYYFLMTIFSPAYDKTTARSSYGVPLVTSVDPTVPLPARPDLQAFVDTLLNSVTSAIPDLPETNLNKTRVTKNIAYGMLCKIYHYLGDYTNSLKYAEIVLASPDAKIVDYNDYPTMATFPKSNVSPGELLYKSGSTSKRQLSPDLVGKYDMANDLRCKLFYPPTSGFYYFTPNAIHPNCGITYAEIFLNKAECLARSGSIPGALTIVNEKIRKSRFAPANYTALTAATPEAALTAVLEERRRELAFKNVRWSDMKRLDKEGRMPAVTRLSGFTGTATVLATLEPHSRNYTLQIPLMVQKFNPSMPLNP
jgi:hypothetical protein